MRMNSVSSDSKPVLVIAGSSRQFYVYYHEHYNEAVFVYIHNINALRGYLDFEYVLVGTWQEREDLEDLYNEIIARGGRERSHILVKLIGGDRNNAEITVNNAVRSINTPFIDYRAEDGWESVNQIIYHIDYNFIYYRLSNGVRDGSKYYKAFLFSIEDHRRIINNTCINRLEEISPTNDFAHGMLCSLYEGSWRSASFISLDTALEQGYQWLATLYNVTIKQSLQRRNIAISEDRLTRGLEFQGEWIEEALIINNMGTSSRNDDQRITAQSIRNIVYDLSNGGIVTQRENTRLSKVKEDLEAGRISIQELKKIIEEKDKKSLSPKEIDEQLKGKPKRKLTLD